MVEIPPPTVGVTRTSRIELGTTLNNVAKEHTERITAIKGKMPEIIERFQRTGRGKILEVTPGIEEITGEKTEPLGNGYILPLREPSTNLIVLPTGDMLIVGPPEGLSEESQAAYHRDFDPHKHEPFIMTTSEVENIHDLPSGQRGFDILYTTRNSEDAPFIQDAALKALTALREEMDIDNKLNQGDDYDVDPRLETVEQFLDDAQHFLPASPYRAKHTKEE